MSDGYPVMLNLTGKTCIVIGGGAVATRKIDGLADTGADLIVVSPEITPAIQIQLELRRVRWLQQRYVPGMLSQYHPTLVFAAIDDPHVNRLIAEEARAIGAWVNVADQPEYADFSNMAILRRSGLTVALSTGGASPALSRHLKYVIEQVIGDEYATLAGWLGDLRAEVSDHVSAQAQRQQLYETILTSDIPALLQRNEIATARDRFESLVREWELAE
jgi:precorrin-2 dehydrogenase